MFHALEKSGNWHHSYDKAIIVLNVLTINSFMTAFKLREELSSLCISWTSFAEKDLFKISCKHYSSTTLDLSKIFRIKFLKIKMFLLSERTDNENQPETMISCEMFLRGFHWKHFHWVNPFHATGLFYTPWKHHKTRCFFNVFRRYRKRPVAWNGLMSNLTGWFLHDGNFDLSWVNSSQEGWRRAAKKCTKYCAKNTAMLLFVVQHSSIVKFCWCYIWK